MSKVTWKGSALLSPVPPVLVTCAYGGKRNVFTVGWTGMICTHPAVTYIAVRPSRYSYDLIKNSGEFAVHLTTADMARTVDFCGVRSGRDVDRFEICHLETEAASEIAAPILTASPVALECKVRDVQSYGTHDIFIADIVAVDAEEGLLDEKGKLDLGKAGLLAYAHGSYYALGEQLGTFGYSVKKQKKVMAPKAPREPKKEPTASLPADVQAELDAALKALAAADREEEAEDGAVSESRKGSGDKKRSKSVTGRGNRHGGQHSSDREEKRSDTAGKTGKKRTKTDEKKSHRSAHKGKGKKQ